MHKYNGDSSRNRQEGYPEPTYYESGADEISLQDLLEVLIRGKWIIAGCLVGVFCIVAAWTMIQDRQYESSAVIYVNASQSNSGLGEILGLDTGNRKIANEIEIVKSYTLAERVARQLMREQVVPGTEAPFTILYDDDGEERTLDNVTEHLRRTLQARAVSRDVDMIEITFRSTLPREAAFIADAYAEQYVDHNQTVSRARIVASREFLDDATQRFNDELQTAETDLLAFLTDQGAMMPDDQASHLLEQIADLERVRYQTQLELGMAETTLRELNAELERITPGLAAQLASGDDRVIDQLNEQIASRVVRIEERYAANPDLRADPSSDAELVRLQNQVAGLRAELDQRSTRLLEGVLAGGAGLGSGGQSVTASRLSALHDLRSRVTEKQIEMRTLQSRMTIVTQNLDQFRAELGNIPNKAVLLNRLDRAQQNREQLYFSLIQRLQEVRIAERSEIGFVEIIDRARVPQNPVSPRVKLNLLLGIMLGLMLGVGAAIARHALDNKVRRPEDLRQKGFSVLGTVVDMEADLKRDFGGAETIDIGGMRVSTRLTTLLNPLAPVSESYRHIRTNIQFSRVDQVVQTILITSSQKGEGKSTSAANIALTMAQSGRRTLIIEADLRRPTVHKQFGVRREPGLVNILMDGPDAPGVESFATQIDDLYVIPAGPRVPNPAEVLGSRRMREFLNELKEQFDVIVIDTPPLLAVADAALLSTQADVTLIVTRAGETEWPVLQRSAEILSDVGARIGGVVLNRFDPKDGQSRYGYYQAYGYGASYVPEVDDEDDPASMRKVSV
jgi:capsular exopolysaccharide synthesis family protein